MNLKTREIQTLHRIIEARNLDLFDLLKKDFTASEPVVCLSAIRALEALRFQIPLELLSSVYRNHKDDVRIRILEYLKNVSNSEYKDFLLDLYRGELSDFFRPKVILALGSLAHEDTVILEILRTSADMCEPDEGVRLYAITAMFRALEIKWLQNLLSRSIELDSEKRICIKILELFSQKRDKQIFLDLYSLWRKRSSFFDWQSFELIQSMFLTFQDDPNATVMFNQLKERILGWLRSESDQEFSFALDLVSGISHEDSLYMNKICSILLVAKGHGVESVKKIRKFLEQFLSRHLENEANARAMESIVFKLFTQYKDTILKRIRSFSGLPGVDPRRDFTEFFESLGNNNLLLAVIAFLRETPPTASKMNLILSVLKKLQPSLNPRQSQLLPSVLKLLVNEDGRLRSAIAIDLGKIDLEQSVGILFSQISFLSPFLSQISSVKAVKAFIEVFRVILPIPGSKACQNSILKGLLICAREEGVRFAFDYLSRLSDVDLAFVSQEIRTVELSTLEFLKKSIQKGSPVVELISYSLSCLARQKTLVDSEWIAILNQIHTGSEKEEFQNQAKILLAKFGQTVLISEVARQLRREKYILKPKILDTLSLFLEGLSSVESEGAGLLRDVIYGCLIEENQKFYPALGKMLLDLEEPHGREILLSCLTSTDEKLVSDAIISLKKSSCGQVWKEVLECIRLDSFSVHQEILGYFGFEFPGGFDQDALKQKILEVSGGQKPEESKKHGKMLKKTTPEEKKQLKELFDHYRTRRMDNKTRFELEKNLVELTIFFIDIAGYTKRSNTSSISEIMLLLEDFSKLICPLGEKFRGTMIKQIGDCFMYTFESRLDSVLFSIAVQKSIERYNEFRAEPEKLHTRIGLNTGKVFVKDGDVYGDPVNMASRVESKAPTDGILIHANTFEGISEFVEFRKMDLIQVKGVEEPIQTYQILEAKPGVMAMYMEEIGKEDGNVVTLG